MSAADAFSPAELDRRVTTAVAKVFSTMLDMEATFIASEERAVHKEGSDDIDGPLAAPALESPHPTVVGIVGFVGDLDGVFYFHLDEPLSMRVASSFLGMTEEEVNEEGPETINDVMGELSNMIGGSFKNLMDEDGFDCRMTLPAIMRGTNVSIEAPAAAVRRLFRFETAGRSFVTEVILKPA